MSKHETKNENNLNLWRENQINPNSPQLRSDEQLHQVYHRTTNLKNEDQKI